MDQLSAKYDWSSKSVRFAWGKGIELSRGMLFLDFWNLFGLICPVYSSSWEIETNHFAEIELHLGFAQEHWHSDVMTTTAHN